MRACFLIFASTLAAQKTLVETRDAARGQFRGASTGTMNCSRWATMLWNTLVLTLIRGRRVWS
jgi:hypothetical protein